MRQVRTGGGGVGEAAGSGGLALGGLGRCLRRRSIAGQLRQGRPAGVGQHGQHALLHRHLPAHPACFRLSDSAYVSGSKKTCAVVCGCMSDALVVKTLAL